MKVELVSTFSLKIVNQQNIYNWTIDITNNKNFFLIKDNNDEFLASYNNTNSNLTIKTTDTDYTTRWIFLPNQDNQTFKIINSHVNGYKTLQNKLFK